MGPHTPGCPAVPQFDVVGMISFIDTGNAGEAWAECLPRGVKRRWQAADKQARAVLNPSCSY